MPGSGDSFKKATSGDPFRMSADCFNSLIDTDAWRKRQQSSRQAPPATAKLLESGHCYIKNTTGANLARFAVVGLDDPIILPTDNLDGFSQNVGFKGVTPDKSKHIGKFAVLMEPAANNAIALATVSGVVPITLTINSTSDQFAEIIDGSTAGLASKNGAGSAQILWAASGSTGGVNAIVRIGNKTSGGFWAKITDNSGTVGYPYAYSWTEQYETYTAGQSTLSDLTGGRFGTKDTSGGASDLGPAINTFEEESPNNGFAPIRNNTYVWIEPGSDNQSPSKSVWRFKLMQLPVLTVGQGWYGTAVPGSAVVTVTADYLRCL